MSKFYCNICKKDVTLKDGICPECNTNWNKVIDDSINGEPINTNDEPKKEELDIFGDKIEVRDTDIDNNIYFFIRWALISKVFLIILGILSILLFFVYYESTDGGSIEYLIYGIILLFISTIVENQLKWKAYGLKYLFNKTIK